MNFDTRVFQKDVQNSDGKPQLPTDLVIQDQSPIDPLVSQIKFCLRTWALDPKSILPINYSLLSHVVLVVCGMQWVMQGPALGSTSCPREARKNSTRAGVWAGGAELRGVIGQE